MRGSSFSMLAVCLSVFLSNGCAKYDGGVLGTECVRDADCPEGYHCDPDVERCRKDVEVPECETNYDCPEDYWCDRTNWKCRPIECIPNCTGKCCGSDGCDGVCPDNCPVDASCNPATCQCEELLECRTNSDCPQNYWCDRTVWMCRPIECIPNCTGKCCGSDGCDGTCPNNCPAGYYCHLGSCECRPEYCQNDSDCMYHQCCIQGICTNMSCGAMECGPDPVCGKECGPCAVGYHCDQGVCVRDVTCVVDTDCPAGRICLDGRCIPYGDGSPGDPCTFGDVNASAGDCSAGLVCLGVPADGSAGTCPGGSSRECTNLMEEWNIDCVNGNCGVSFCAEECDAVGSCPAGFDPVNVSDPPVCFCIPGANGDGLPGDPCPWGDVNAEYDSCAPGLACLGNDDIGPCPGGTPAECTTEIPDSYNPDCVNGACGFSFCSEQCDAQGNCPAGFEPADVSGTCYCIPA